MDKFYFFPKAFGFPDYVEVKDSNLQRYQIENYVPDEELDYIWVLSIQNAVMETVTDITPKLSTKVRRELWYAILDDIIVPWDVTDIEPKDLVW